MKGMTLGHAANSVFLLLSAIWCSVILVRGMRQNPKDRVFWFEACAMMSLAFACIIAYFWGTAALSISIVFLLLFFIFTVLAGYSAVMNWVRRRKRTT